MNQPLTRRQLLGSSLLFFGSACGDRAPRAPSSTSSLAASAAGGFTDIERRIDGRLGVFAVDVGSGRMLAHRADERFAMCSTFKWVLAAAVLARVDRGELSLADRVPYGEVDLLDHSPVTRARLADGALTIEALAQAAVTVSDNAAANLLLSKVGGPAGVTAFARTAGDEVTRLDRKEPELNSNDPGDERDTTSPRAMAGLMRRLIGAGPLAAASRDRLIAWLRACETGKDRIRAGLPADWVVGDKTGTGRNGAVNDVAIAYRPNGAPIVVAVYTSDSRTKYESLVAAHAEVGRLVARELA